MNKRLPWSRILYIVGAGMIIIAPAALGLLWWRYASRGESELAWLLYVLIVLPAVGSGLVALGVFLGRSRYRKFLRAALALTICGWVAALRLFVVTVADSYSGPDPWWVQSVVFAYPIGIVMSCVGAVLAIIESFHRSPIAQGSVHVT